MTEQIGHDVSRLHRLELENQKLKSELDSIRLNGIQETSEKILKLEKENKKYSMTLKKLEEVHAKDTECNVNLEKDLAKLKSQNAHLEAVRWTFNLFFSKI